MPCCTTALSETTQLPTPALAISFQPSNCNSSPLALLSQSRHPPLYCISLLCCIHHMTLSLLAFPSSSYKEHSMVRRLQWMQHVPHYTKCWLLQRMCCMNCCGSKLQRCFHACSLLPDSHGQLFPWHQHTSGTVFKEMGQNVSLEVQKAQNRTELVISVLLRLGRSTAFWRVSKAGNVIWERQLGSLTVSFSEACLLFSVMLIYLNSFKGRPSGWCSGRQKHRKRLFNKFAPTPTFFIISGCFLH